MTFARQGQDTAVPAIARLEDMLGYQVYHTNMLAMRGARPALAGLDITPGQLTALLFLRDHPGCDQTSLSRLLAVNRSAAMKLVIRLSGRDLIERRQGRDQRTLGLWLRPRGEQLLDSVPAALQVWDGALSQSLTSGERAMLLCLLGKVRDSIWASPGEALTGVA
ncbi:MAG: marR family protein [Sphingomonas bacterium]|nr:marR family protein [Sphingomonas bacterium]